MKIGLATSGLKAHKHAIQHLSGGQIGFLWPFGLGLDAIAGWGHKPTSNRARKIAARRRLPYLAFEDGFLRSVLPGNTESPLSLVLDRSGIYYDARSASDLETFVTARSQASSLDPKIARGLEALREARLSKYNHFEVHDIADLKLGSSSRQYRVLVVDQTAGDASIVGAHATEQSFIDMLLAAVKENPKAKILIKVHPETMQGRKAGHFSHASLETLAAAHPELAQAQGDSRLRLTPEAINPWALLEDCSKVYCVSSQLGFEALMAGCQVVTFGTGFYSGYGLTDDRNPTPLTRRQPASLEALFAALYFDYSHYFAEFPFREISFFEAVDLLGQRIATATISVKACTRLT
ncbi:hypothetical protein [Roseibium algae]|uniref:Capsular polysaccharide export protein n=1 Tax=Roseibium algae TaxID=3123038 RepID=A0ABU8TLP9_9HYPH